MTETIKLPRLWFIIYRHPERGIIAKVFYPNQANQLPPRRTRLLTLTNTDMAGPILHQIHRLRDQAAEKADSLGIDPDDILWIKNF